MDLISIGITCYNAEDTIERAVRSAQEQTWSNLEIVVIDDCSTDSSWAVLQRLASQDARVRVLRQSVNRGEGAARNTLLNSTSGAFIAFFDDDDVSRPQRVEQQHRRIVEYERDTRAQRVVCYTATEQVYPDGSVEYSSCLGTDVTPAPFGAEVARLILLGQPTRGDRGVCPNCSQMARRSVYEAIGGYDETLRRHVDTDLNIRLALEGTHFVGMAEPLVIQTMTFTHDKTVHAEHTSALELIDKHKELLERWKWYGFARGWCQMKFALFERGVAPALPQALRLGLASPIKMARKVAWTFPNRKRYKKYKYAQDASA